MNEFPNWLMFLVFLALLYILYFVFRKFVLKKIRSSKVEIKRKRRRKK